MKPLTTSKLKFNPNAKSYVPANQTNNNQNNQPNQQNSPIQQNNQPNQPFFSFKSVYPENGMEDMNQYVDKTLGTALPDNSEETIIVRKTCLELAGAQKEKFPGSLAASLTKQNAALTRGKNYLISHNIDGSRYLLLTINDNIYLIDRSMRVFYVTKLFSPTFISVIGNNTLIDGYILKRKEVENFKVSGEDKSEEKKGEEEKNEENKNNEESNKEESNNNNNIDNNKQEENKSVENKEQNFNNVFFLIVDGICIEDQTVRAFHLEQRMKNIEKLFSPLLTTFKTTPKTETVENVESQNKDEKTENNNNNNSNNSNNVPPFVISKPEEKHTGKISVAVQQYYQASQLEQMFKKQFHTFGFPRVGILFSPSNEIYKLGYNEYLLLWKPMEQITVDFKVGLVKKLSKGNVKLWYQLLKSNHGELILHDWITEKGGSKLSKITDGQVIRCFWDPNGTTIVPPTSGDEKAKEYKGGWVMRTILNKTQPNEEWVVSKLVENIESHISKQDLIRCVTTDKELSEDFKVTTSRFAPKKRVFWKQNNSKKNYGDDSNNNTSPNNNSFNNNSNQQNNGTLVPQGQTSYFNNNSYPQQQPFHFNHQSSSSSSHHFNNNNNHHFLGSNN